eukprot:XP_017947202.1 PREDICTED: uncharacterized protein LOC100487218 [Xenopus tropicalis]
MAQAEPLRATVEEKALGALQGTLERVSKNKFCSIKKKLKDWQIPGRHERIPESSLQCAHRAELASLIIRHYGAHYGVELVQQVLEDVGDQEGSRELREFLEREGTSFMSWWKWKSRFPHLSPNDLAQAGFYYVGPGDRVRCFSCGGEVENWQPGHVPLSQHGLAFPYCPYVRGKMGMDAGIVGQMQKLSLKHQPVYPDMAEEWDRLATYRPGPWYPGEQPKQDQSRIKMMTQAASIAPSMYETQVPFPGGNVLFPGPFVPTFQSGPTVGGVDPEVQKMKESFTGGGIQHQGPVPGVNILFPLPVVGTFQLAVTGGGINNQQPFPGSQIIFPVPITVMPGPTVGLVGGVQVQVQKMEGSSTGQEKAPSAVNEGGASGVQEASSINWLYGGTVECVLCGKIPPQMHFNAPMIGQTYRAHLPWKGLFRCFDTGIQFFVNTPAVIDFELVSWGCYSKHLQENRLETVGPLFNIRVLSGQVSAVYLPHYVCLKKGGDVDVKKFKIIHYKANGMTLETPSKIEPFYVALEKPTFSLMGVVYKVANLFRTKIPTHGAVFIYSKFIKGYTIHLYFMPQDHSVRQAVHKKETNNGYFWVDKPPLTRTVYTQRKYVVQGPESARINPEDLKLRFDAKPEMYNYSEIYLPNVDEEIVLRVTSEREEKSVWAAMLRKEELISGGQKAAGGRHFVDKHRAELIERIPNIDPVLDELLGDGTLTQEQYDIVRCNRTPQEKMRQLFGCVRAWGGREKDALFRAMNTYHQPLICDLQEK